MKFVWFPLIFLLLRQFINIFAPAFYVLHKASKRSSSVTFRAAAAIHSIIYLSAFKLEIKCSVAVSLEIIRNLSRLKPAEEFKRVYIYIY